MIQVFINICENNHFLIFFFNLDVIVLCYVLDLWCGRLYLTLFFYFIQSFLPFRTYPTSSDGFYSVINWYVGTFYILIS